MLAQLSLGSYSRASFTPQSKCVCVCVCYRVCVFACVCGWVLTRQTIDNSSPWGVHTPGNYHCVCVCVCAIVELECVCVCVCVSLTLLSHKREESRDRGTEEEGGRERKKKRGERDRGLTNSHQSRQATRPPSLPLPPLIEERKTLLSS